MMILNLAGNEGRKTNRHRMTSFSAWKILNWRRRLTCLATVWLWLAMSANSAAFQASHNLAVTLDPDTASLSGTDRIRLVDCPQGILPIGLNPHIRIQSLQVNGVPQAAVPTDTGPAIDLSAADREAPIELILRYEGQFQDEAPIQPVNTDNPGYGVSGTISPRGTLLLGGAGWYPAIAGAIETLHVRVEAPEGISAVTAGRSIGVTTTDGKTVSHWQIDPPAERLSLSAGRYVPTASQAGNVPTTTYFLSNDHRLADTYLQATANYIALYENQFGPYPFPKFAIVENFFPTGYGFPSYTLIGGRVLRLPFIVRTSLGHEIAHCWWGNGVRIDPTDGNWSEGLTSYVAEHQYQEMDSAEAGRQHRQQLLRNYATLVAPEEDFPLRRFSHRYSPQTKVIGYDKSAMVFHMLRQAVGDRAFQEGLRRLYATRLHQETNWKDIQTAFEYASDSDLTWFFDQWLDRAGAPSLWFEEIQTTVVSPQTHLVRGVLRQRPPFFRLQVPVALSSTTSDTVVNVAIDGPAAPFQITVSGEPKRLAADPETHVFRRLAPEEIPTSINALKQKAPLLIIVPSDRISPVQQQTAATLARALGRSDMIIQREKDLAPDQMVTHDLVIMGGPELPLLKHALQNKITLRPGGFDLNGQAYNADRNCFFGVWPHPLSKDHIMAVLLHGSENHQERIARKVPHYGRYSYLVFAETTNQVKGNWPTIASPLVHVWSTPPG
jgi:Peptidase family M1 domain